MIHYIFFLHLKEAVEKLESQVSRITVKHLLRDHFKLIKVPLPYIIEQKIAEILL